MPVKELARIDELKATGKLPSPTGVAFAILRLTHNENTSIQEITHVLQTDPALTGQILKYANSAHVGVRRPAVALSDAVVRLGLRTVRQLALGFSLLSNYRGGPCKAFDYQDFWSRSLATAIAVQALGRHTNIAPPDESFACGLLSQIGRLALATVHPERYGKVLLAWRGGPIEELCRLERERFAIDHVELTAALLDDWGLPDLYVAAVRYHETPGGGALAAGSREQKFAEHLHLAVGIAAICHADKEQCGRLAGELGPAAQQIGIDSAPLAVLCDGVVSEWRAWGRILDVPTHDVPSWADLAGGSRESPAAPELKHVPTAPAAHESLRVLAVDDNPIDLRLLSKQLASAGHTVLTARDGREALCAVLQTNPQLVITDQIMPEMDGLELCRALRRSENGQQIYVIMLTGYDDEERLVEALRAGVDDYVVKPFSPRALSARVRAAGRIIRLQEEVERRSGEVRRYAAELGVVNRQLEVAALTDALTGLPNRRYAMERLGQEWAAASRSGRPLACMIVDIDHFKRVNDTWGHTSGDAVLRETAALVRRSVRENDVACRLGGEEFVVICPDTGAVAAGQLAERLRAGAEAHNIQARGFNGPVHVSIGVAECTEPMRTTDDILKAADEALYAAKRAGRNRVCVAGQTQGNLSPALS